MRMRVVLLAIGALAVLMGVVWIGQGTGVFPYPASSFMIDEIGWAYRGAGLALVGVIILFAAGRIARRR